MREITMSIQQFNAIQRGEMTYKDLKKSNKLELIAGEILKNDRLKRLTIFTIAGLNVMCKVSADTTNAVTKINSAGNTFLGIFQSIGYWLCLIGAIMEILKCVMNGSSKDVGKIILKYVLVFASIYLIPFAFDLIKEIFG